MHASSRRQRSAGERTAIPIAHKPGLGTVLLMMLVAAYVLGFALPHVLGVVG